MIRIMVSPFLTWYRTNGRPVGRGSTHKLVSTGWTGRSDKWKEGRGTQDPWSGQSFGERGRDIRSDNYFFRESKLAASSFMPPSVHTAPSVEEVALVADATVLEAAVT